MIKIKKRKAIIISLLFISVCILLGIWHVNTTRSKLVNYRTDKVQLGTIEQTVSANGTLNPVALVTVGAQVTGKVQKIYADFNAHVKAGQVLLELDNTLLKTAVAQSTAEVNKAEAYLALAIANEKRGTKLYVHKYLAQQDWEQLVQVRKEAQAELDVAKAKLLQDQTSLNYTVIYSPVSGVIVDREVDFGQTVTSGFQTPTLFKIAQDLSKMQIDSSFAEADIGSIRDGQPAIFTVDAYPNRNFYGIVKQTRLNPTVQQNVVSYDVVIDVANLDGVLLPGMTAYVNIKIAEHNKVLMVSNAALRFRPKNEQSKSDKQDPAKGVIYKILQNGKIEPITCRLGITDSHNTEIISDKITEGDAVAIGYIYDDATTSSKFHFKAL